MERRLGSSDYTCSGRCSQSKFPNSPPGNLVPGDPGVPSTISPIRWNNVGPRIGIAYAPRGGKTSVRAAFGIYYLGAADNGNFGILGDAHTGASTGPRHNQHSLQVLTLRARTAYRRDSTSPFTFPSGPGPFPNFQFGSLMPLYVPGYYNKNKTTNATHYNLSVQQQLGKSTILTMAYVGTQGHHIEHGEDIIWGSAPLCLSIPWLWTGRRRRRLHPGRSSKTYYGTFTGGNRQPKASASTTRTPMAARLLRSHRRPTCRTRVIQTTTLYRTSVEQRARDLTFLAVLYVGQNRWTTNLRSGIPVIPAELMVFRRSTKLRHNFVASYNWTLPFDRAFGSNRLTQGWHITGISRFNTGFPISLKSGGDAALTNIGLDYPTQIAPVKKLNPHDPAHTFITQQPSPVI